MSENCILISGGCGFIGSNLIDYLKDNSDDKIINIDKISYASNEMINEKYKDDNYYFYKTDINNIDELSKIFDEHKPDTIYHLAAESHVDRSIDGPKVFINSNILGTFNLLDLSLKYFNSLEKSKKNNFRFIMVSTDEVYGSIEKGERAKEINPYKPSSPYSASKASADNLAEAWFKTYNLPVITTNTTNNYGPLQFPEKLIPLTISKILNEQEIPIYGKGNQIRDWIHVSDHVKGLIYVRNNGKIGEKYNIGNECEKTNLEVVSDICSKIDIKLKSKKDSYNLITFVEDRPGHDFRYSLDNEKIKNLGWKPEIDWNRGIENTIDWYINNNEWIKKILENNYKGERLGLDK